MSCVRATPILVELAASMIFCNVFWFASLKILYKIYRILFWNTYYRGAAFCFFDDHHPSQKLDNQGSSVQLPCAKRKTPTTFSKVVGGIIIGEYTVEAGKRKESL